ncbi:MAG: DUF4115 domain-containing protein [Gammaproteobacteria bacterium]|nr:DUF4115 domain-containing protein [Gammaproteobacteria bacterium]
MYKKLANKTETEADPSTTEEMVDASPGDRLRKARETMGMSAEEAAHDLRLDYEVVIALEAAHYETLGAPVFIRGYMRSYARLLGLPEDEIVAGFVAYETEPEEFRTLSTQSVVKPGASLANFMLWVLLGIVIFAGLIYLMIGDEKEPVGEVDKGEFIAPVTDSVVVEPAAEPVSTGPVLMQLTLSFTEECWVEVSDTRNRLIYGLEKPGTSITVEGEPPLRLFLGNLQAVSMKLDGEVFMVPGRARSRNNTARFTINATDKSEAKQE